MKKYAVIGLLGVLFLVVVLRRGEACQGCQQRKAKLKNFLGVNDAAG